MSNLSKVLAACSASLLLLGSATGSAAATRAEQAAPAGPDSQLEQVAPHGDRSAAEPRPEHPERFVRIAGFTWSRAATVMQADLTIESVLPFALKEVEVACAQFARSGVEVESSRHRIAEIVPARGRLQIEALSIGQINPEAGSSGCRIVSVTPA